MIMSLPARTAAAAAVRDVGLDPLLHTMRPTLSQSVMSVPVYPHSPRSTSLSSQSFVVIGTPSVVW